MTRRGGLAASWLLLAAAIVVSVGCSAPGASGGATLVAAPVPNAALARIGDFELVDARAAIVDAVTALDEARSKDFGRPGIPEASLVRARTTSPEAPGISAGRLVWVFHWGSLGEEYPKAFPPLGPDRTPQMTVFVKNDYFLVVDAASGEVLLGLLM